MKPIIWSIKEIVNILIARQENEFDGNMAVSGDRGNGKSTVINKIFYRFPQFRPWKHQIYNRDDAIKLLKEQTFGLCWDDEAINSGYKRNFYERGQQEFIKFLTAYRDNYNLFASAIPNFFSLDKDLRDLYFIHLHVIERGIAVVHMPIQGKLYAQDRWDAKYNAKIEESWGKKLLKNPDFKIPYHRLTTFRGYLHFSDLTQKQKDLYKEIKKVKRAESFVTADGEDPNKITFLQKIYNQLVQGKITKSGLQQMCLMEGKKYSSVTSSLNQMLTDSGDKHTLKNYLVKDERSSIHSSTQDDINQLIPQM